MIEYFSHDYNARNDIKLKKLFMKEGLQGIGLYWCLVEMLYEKGGRVELEYIPIIAFDLRTEEDFVRRIINDYELFERDDIFFYSPSILKRLQIRQDKSEKAKSSANARWNKSDCNADEIQTQCERNANAEQTDSDCIAKEKKIKVNNIINNNIKEKSVEKKDTTPFDDFVKTYGINVDNYSVMITQMDFTALSKVYKESVWLQKNIISLSRICKEYQKIIGGYYKDYESVKKPILSTFALNSRHYTEEELKPTDIDEIEL